MKKYLILGLVFVMAASVVVLAINTTSTGWRIPKTNVAINVVDSSNVCHVLTASTSCLGDVFVPTKVIAEWNAFNTNKPSCVTIVNNSCCTLPWGGTINSGQSVTAWQNSTSCTSCISQTRTCNNGILSGSYSYSNCFIIMCR